MDRRVETIIGLVAFVAIAVVLVFHYCQYINLANADLGRHLKNGEVFVEMDLIPGTNLYSYTEPDYPMVTHHWGSGVVYYYVHQWWGFKGLSVLNTSLYILAFAFFYFAAGRQSGYLWAILFSLLAIPLISGRAEVRPEVFSYMFLGLYFFLLNEVRAKRISFSWLWLLLPLQLLWVNLHIFFVMGIFLAGVFLVDYYFSDKAKVLLREYLLLLVGLVLISLINPWGFNGLIEPFFILTEYGYMVAENQSVKFMFNRFGGGEYIHFMVVSASSVLLLITGIVYGIFNKKLTSLIMPFLLLIIYNLLAWRMIPNIPLFGYVFIPMMAGLVALLIKGAPSLIQGLVKSMAIGGSLLLLLVAVFPRDTYYAYREQTVGLGLLNDVENTAKFCQAAGIRGPIFNNYDIGGYLIYYFFPEKKVFVDNRPEAYSVEFFEELYNPMLANEEIWAAADKRFNFNAIIFYRHDMTEHGQPFLIRRIEDKAWAPVFVDNYNIVFLKRNVKNLAIIERYELPKEMFGASAN